MLRIDYAFLVTSWETASPEGRLTIEAEMVACYIQCGRGEEARQAVQNYLDAMILEMVEQPEDLSPNVIAHYQELYFKILAAEIFLRAIDAYTANPVV